MFTQIIAAGFDVLTYFKGSWARSASEAFTTVDYQSPDGTAHTYELAERLIDLPVPAQPATGHSPPPSATWPQPKTLPAKPPATYPWDRSDPAAGCWRPKPNY